MKITALLPHDRTKIGVGWVEDAGGTTLRCFAGEPGPGSHFPCRGKADNATAEAHHNAVRDSTRAFGDHPYGGYRIVSARPSLPSGLTSFGPWFLLLDPVSGDALTAKQGGREGIGVHGGAPGPDGELRATYGCLRVPNDIIRVLGPMVSQALERGEDVTYECAPL